MNFLINIILDLLFPRRCPVCGQIVMPKGSLICPGCVKKLSWVRGPVCKCCGKEIISGTMEYCPDCAAHPRSFSHGMALFNYNEILYLLSYFYPCYLYLLWLFICFLPQCIIYGAAAIRTPCHPIFKFSTAFCTILLLFWYQYCTAMYTLLCFF